MKNKFLILLSCFAICSCQDSVIEDQEMEDPEIDVELCLNNISIESSNLSCATPPNQDCDFVYVGTKGISSNLKSKFTDFCREEGSDITFTNSSGNTTNANITRKNYFTNRALLTTNVNTPNCTHFCMDNEEARVEFTSNSFSLEIMLYSGLSVQADTTYTLENASSGYFIWSIIGNSRQAIFNIELENFLDETLSPDTSRIKFYENIELNGNNYSGIFSNEKFNPNSINYTEKIYFHPDDGLVAVVDSLGQLWTKN